MVPLLALLLIALGLAAYHPAHAITPGFPYGSQKVRGVNLGGWLVLEVSEVDFLNIRPSSDLFQAMDHPLDL